MLRCIIQTLHYSPSKVPNTAVFHWYICCFLSDECCICCDDFLHYVLLLELWWGSAAMLVFTTLAVSWVMSAVCCDAFLLFTKLAVSWVIIGVYCDAFLHYLPVPKCEMFLFSAFAAVPNALPVCKSVSFLTLLCLVACKKHDKRGHALNVLHVSCCYKYSKTVVLYNTVQYFTAQYCTVQYCVLHSTVLYNTVLHSTYMVCRQGSM